MGRFNKNDCVYVSLWFLYSAIATAFTNTEQRVSNFQFLYDLFVSCKIKRILEWDGFCGLTICVYRLSIFVDLILFALTYLYFLLLVFSAIFVRLSILSVWFAACATTYRHHRCPRNVWHVRCRSHVVTRLQTSLRTPTFTYWTVSALTYRPATCAAATTTATVSMIKRLKD